MRDAFYADNRDLVKWGILLHLAKQFGAARILQVAFYRPELRWPKLEIDGDERSLPVEVIRHFRDLHDIKRLNNAGSSVRIDILDAPFGNASREGYVQKVAAAMAASESTPSIVFLDPDTGLGQNEKHVRANELLEIWERMHPDDVLVFYQHAHRNNQWITIRRREFEHALKIPDDAAHVARGGISPKGGRFCSDVAFFFVQKKRG